MALNPAVIKRMLETSERLKWSEPEAAFLVSWAALEGYLHRVLVVGIQFQGVRAKDAVQMVSGLGIHKRTNLESSLGSLLGERPSNLRGYGGKWRNLYARNRGSHRSYYERRHGLIHGSQHASPAILRDGVDAISEIVHLPLFGDCEVIVHTGSERGTTVALGNVLLPYRGRLGSKGGSATPTGVAATFNWALRE